MKNTWRKSRPIDNPYYQVTDRYGFTRKVLRLYGDPRKPYARAFMATTNPDPGVATDELGDDYTENVQGLVAAWLKAHPEGAKT